MSFPDIVFVSILKLGYQLYLRDKKTCWNLFYFHLLVCLNVTQGLLNAIDRADWDYMLDLVLTSCSVQDQPVSSEPAIIEFAYSTSGLTPASVFHTGVQFFHRAPLSLSSGKCLSLKVSDQHYFPAVNSTPAH